MMALWLVPLYNFDSDFDSLQIDRGVLIRRIRTDELDIIKRTANLSAEHLSILNEVKFLLEVKKKEDPRTTMIFLYVFDLVRALRLLKAGDVNFSFTFLKQKDRIILRLGNPFRMPVAHRKYTLMKKESEELKALWKKVLKSNSKAHATYALSEFEEAYDKEAMEDEIVNYATAFESVVFYKMKKSIEPIGEIIGLAIGMLLGKDAAERVKIRKDLVEAYKIRNARVHGNAEKLYKMWIGRGCANSEEYLRRTLRKLVEE